MQILYLKDVSFSAYLLNKVWRLYYLIPPHPYLFRIVKVEETYKNLPQYLYF